VLLGLASLQPGVVPLVGAGALRGTVATEAELASLVLVEATVADASSVVVLPGWRLE
jgi:hypothetical protein